MPQRTREIIARLANKHLAAHVRALASERLNNGLVTYGATNHLRPDCAETCHACGERLVDYYPCNYCPQCRAEVRPYNAERECAEELLDAHNQAGIAKRRGDWPAWKVDAIAKLCGIGLAILDAIEETDVHEYARMIALVSSPADMPARAVEEL